MGFFDDVFGDPEKQFKKDIERWKKEDEAWMAEVRYESELIARTGDPEADREYRRMQRKLDREFSKY